MLLQQAQDHQANPIVRNGAAEEEAVAAVQKSTMPRNHRARILHAGVTFEKRLAQIAQLRANRDKSAHQWRLPDHAAKRAAADKEVVVRGIDDKDRPENGHAKTGKRSLDCFLGADLGIEQMLAELLAK